MRSEGDVPIMGAICIEHPQENAAPTSSYLLVAP